MEQQRLNFAAILDLLVLIEELVDSIRAAKATKMPHVHLVRTY